MTVLITEDGRRSVGAIEVQPEFVLLAYVGEGREVVDGAGVGGASGRDHAERFETGSAIMFDLMEQMSRIELEAIVDRDSAERFATETQQADGFVERMMSLRGSVD